MTDEGSKKKSKSGAAPPNNPKKRPWQSQVDGSETQNQRDVQLAAEEGVHRSTIWRRRQKALKLAAQLQERAGEADDDEEEEEDERDQAPVSAGSKTMTTAQQVTSDCGQCVACLDKPRFGGPGIKRKCCVLKIAN